MKTKNRTNVPVLKRAAFLLLLPVVCCFLTAAPVMAEEDEEEIPIEDRIGEAQKEIRTKKVGKYGMTANIP